MSRLRLVAAITRRLKRFAIIDKHMDILHSRKLWLMPLAAFLLLFFAAPAHTGAYALHGQKTRELTTQCQNTCPVLQATSKGQEINAKKDIDPQPGAAVPYYAYFAGLAYFVPAVLGTYILAILVGRPPDLVRLYVRYQN